MENKYVFKVEGPAFDETMPLHLVIESLSNFQSIVDKTYLGLKGSKQRISKKERQFFQIQASSFEKGSLIINFDIFFAATQFSLPFMTTLGPQNVWDYTRESFNFLKLIYGAAQRDVQPNYSFENNSDFNVHVGDNHYHFHGPVYQIGESAQNNYRKLAHLTGLGVSSIKAGPADNPEIALGPDDENLFDLPSQIDQKPITVNCEIFDFNKFGNNGKLLVGESQAVPEGEYKFTIWGDQDNVNYIYSTLRPQVTISCLKERRLNPFEGEAVFKLHITGVE